LECGDSFVHGSLKIVGLLVVIGGLIVLLAQHGSGVTGLGDRDQLSLVYKIGVLILVGSLVLRIFRDRLGEALQAALLWVVVALVLVAGYTYRFELKDIGDRMTAELVPGRASARGHVVEVVRASSGDFYINTEVNGARVPMVFDTGASSVMLTRDAAVAAGLPVEMIKYTVNIETANGRAHAAAAVIDRIAVGGIVERSVPALIAQPGTLKTSLLGLSFLSRLQSYEVRGDRVVMRGAQGSAANSP
jgi:aspartyl protease family protein